LADVVATDHDDQPDHHGHLAYRRARADRRRLTFGPKPARGRFAPPATGSAIVCRRKDDRDMTAPSDPAAPSAPPAESPPLALTPAASQRYTQAGYVFALTGALLFSTKSIIIKLAYAEAVDATTLLALRMGFALPIYVAIGLLAVRDRGRRGVPLPRLAMAIRAATVGALGYWFASYADFLGLTYISAQFERLILFTYPLFVVVLGAVFFRLPMRLRTLAAIAVSYAGLALIFTEKTATLGPNIAAGAGLVLAAALAFALYQLLAKPVIAVMGPRLFTCIAMSGAAVAVFAQFVVTHPLAGLAIGPRVAALAVAIALGATVLPSFFLNAALHRVSAQANATIGTLSPVMTILLAVIVLGEALTMTDIAGAALVLAGVGWFTLADRRR
jgi:drug/metabolite transporter (DMT)-like permease